MEAEKTSAESTEKPKAEKAIDPQANIGHQIYFPPDLYKDMKSKADSLGVSFTAYVVLRLQNALVSP